MKRTLCFLLSLATTGLLARESVNFVSQPLTAGRASLAGDGYILSRTLGEAAFSPELRFPVQLIYDSSSDKGGLFGYGWRSPQLESSVVPDRNTVVWVTPWGEKIQFTAKSAIDKKSLFSFFAPKIKGRGYFTPYGDWEADTPAGGDAAASSGDWAFTDSGRFGSSINEVVRSAFYSIWNNNDFGSGERANQATYDYFYSHPYWSQIADKDGYKRWRKYE